MTICARFYVDFGNKKYWFLTKFSDKFTIFPYYNPLILLNLSEQNPQMWKKKIAITMVRSKLIC
jgi:hypothetical protein